MFVPAYATPPAASTTGRRRMRAPPRLRGGVPARLGVLLVGLLVFAAGIVALLESRLGLSPWDVLHQGLARHTPLSFGAANIAVGVVVLVAALLLGARLGVGTVANATLVGAFVELLTSMDWVTALADESLPVRVGLLVVGLALMGAGTGLYLGADLGAGPRDSLMVVGARRTPFRIGVVRSVLELAALGVGFRPRWHGRSRDSRLCRHHRPGGRAFVLAAGALAACRGARPAGVRRGEPGRRCVECEGAWHQA